MRRAWARYREGRRVVRHGRRPRRLVLKPHQHPVSRAAAAAAVCLGVLRSRRERADDAASSPVLPSGGRVWPVAVGCGGGAAKLAVVVVVVAGWRPALVSSPPGCARSTCRARAAFDLAELSSATTKKNKNYHFAHKIFSFLFFEPVMASPLCFAVRAFHLACLRCFCGDTDLNVANVLPECL